MSFELDGEKQQGSLKKVYTETLEKIRALDGEIRGLHQQELGGLGIQHHEFASACHTVRELHACFEARKYAAKTKHDFYIFVGWMTEAESQRFRREAEADPMVVVTVEEETQTARAPTLLSNPFFARPFEFFVKLYGLPSYNEIDPTSFVALTYTLLFGIMFGDVGQGAALALAGLYMHKARKMPLGAILVILGGSSMVFGALYGSVFGFEDILPAFWLKPTENINSILFVAVGIGVVFILLVMIFNMVNAASQRKWGKLLCSPQGVAGACFYGALIYWILMMVLNVSSALGAVLRPVLIGVMAVALLCVAFHEPAAALLAGRRLPRKPGPAMFLLETFIELFEVLLGYFSNTLSFVRVGAFALSHAGMMHVVMMLSETGGHRNWLVVVLGNLLVIALEGLVVAIQVLRLEFYELFSRFFEGGGRPFVPFNR
jgi:V/A-type H+-transporting ATPase subunit I